MCSQTGQIPTADNFSDRMELGHRRVPSGVYSHIAPGYCDSKTYMVKELRTNNIELIKKVNYFACGEVAKR
jgi:hypothetical protein